MNRGNVDLGEKLYSLRKSHGLTQGQLGKMVGVTEGAIRSYETGKRKPKQNHLEKIAKALNIRAESIDDYGVVTDNQIVHSLFRLEDDRSKLRPTEIDGRVYLAFDNPALNSAMKEWSKHRQELEDSKITQVEYEEWKDRYHLGQMVDLVNGEVVDEDAEI